MVEENKGTGYKWLVQELNPFPRSCGEWRIFIVLSNVIGIVATTPTDEANTGMSFQEYTANYAVEELS